MLHLRIGELTSIACEGSVILILAWTYWKSEPLNDRAPRKITSQHKLCIESIGTASLFPTRFGNLTHQTETHITTISTKLDKSSKAVCSRGASDVVEAYGVVLAGGDEEILLAVEVEAVYLPGLEPNSSRHHGELVRSGNPRGRRRVGEWNSRNRWRPRRWPCRGRSRHPAAITPPPSCPQWSLLQSSPPPPRFSIYSHSRINLVTEDWRKMRHFFYETEPCSWALSFS